jgi:hypothetical protein
MLLIVKENIIEIKLITGHFMKHLMHKLYANKVAIVFSELFEPISPTIALNKAARNQPLAAEEEKIISFSSRKIRR